MKKDKLEITLRGGSASFVQTISAKLHITPNELCDIIVTKRGAELQAWYETHGYYTFDEVVTKTMTDGTRQVVAGERLLNILISDYIKKYENEKEQILIRTEAYDIRCLSEDDKQFLEKRRTARKDQSAQANNNQTEIVQSK